MEPPLLYLYSLGIVSDEINATHEIRLRKLRDRDVLINGSQCEQRCAYAALPPACRAIRIHFCCPHECSRGQTERENVNQDAHVVRLSSR